MDPTPQLRIDAEHGPVVVPFLERRLWAAVCDATIVAVCFLEIVAADPRSRAGTRLWWVAAAALALFGVTEFFTDATPGKRFFGLVVRRRDGAAAPWWALLIRGLVRLLPVMLLLLARFAADPAMSLWLYLLIGCLFSWYWPACYILLIKTGGTLFDHAASTKVMRKT